MGNRVRSLVRGLRRTQVYSPLTGKWGESGPDITAPTITSASAINLAENTAFSHTLTANEAVTWTKTGGADAALFALVGDNLSMTEKNFEAPVDVGANNTYIVQVTATDAALNATNQTITVTVTDVDESGTFPNEDTGANEYQLLLAA